MNINLMQQKIITTEANKVVVLSAPASGKTATVVNRIKYLLNRGENHKEIVAITFTNNAASEMLERLGNPENLFIGTVHSYCNYLLLKAGINTRKVLDANDFDKLFEIIKKHLEAIDHIKYLIVDEAQDSDESQFEFFLNVLKPENWMLIGDLRQSIYGFNGACPEKLIELSKKEDVVTYKMNTNYRNGRKILDYARSIIYPLGEDYYDESIPARQVNGKVVRDCLPLSEIPFLIRDYGAKSYKDWFVLCRSNLQVEQICRALKKEEIPYDTFKQADLDYKELKKRNQDNTVKVLTAHSAKGLEAKNVIVYGITPWSDEERRLAYVAATRAENLLIWITAPRRKRRKRKTQSVSNWE